MAKEISAGKEITAKAIIEILGAPKEHVEKTLAEYIEKISQSKRFNIIKKDLAPAEEQENLFSAFAELEIRFSDVQSLIDFCFDSMPSSVEIIEPLSIEINSAKLTSTLNDLQAKLHRNDMIVKTLRAKNAALEKNTKSVIHNFVYNLISENPQGIDFISEKTGIGKDYIRHFLSELQKEGKITEKRGLYGRAGKGAKKKD